MSDRPGGVRPRPPATAHFEERVESLTVAMALAPGVYSRNRNFGLFANPAVQRAKSRAAMIRGIAQHLRRACAVSLEQEGEGNFVLRYQIPALRLTRVAELSRIELSTLRLLAVRVGATCLLPDDEDRAVVQRALAGLLPSDDGSKTLARAAQGAADADTASTT